MQKVSATARVVLALILVGLGSWSCGDSSPATASEAEIYAVVVRTLVPPENDEETVTRDVFVGREDDSVPLDVQAEVLQELSEYEHIRFVDERNEAIDDDPPMPVHNDGVYVEVRSLNQGSQTAYVRVLRYIDENDQAEVELDLERVGGVWSVTNPDGV